MNWKDHNEWAEELGITKEVSQYVNRVIDEDDESELPDDFKRAIDKWGDAKASQDGAKKGNSALNLVIKKHIKETHDKGAGTKTADAMTGKATTQFLQQKGDKYLDAYYLHHHLDYLSEYRNSGKDFRQLLEELEKSSSKPSDPDITEFLLNHEEELSQELGL